MALPSITAEDDPTLRVVFRFLDGRVQDPGQETELRRRPGTDGWTLRRVGIRAEPFELLATVYARPGAGIAYSEYETRRRLAAMRGRAVTLYPDQTGIYRRCVLLDARYVDRVGLLRYADPLMGEEGVPADAAGFLRFALALVVHGGADFRTELGF